MNNTMRRLSPQDIARGTTQKKISINLDAKMLQMIDELTHILKADRTIIVTNLVAQGIHQMVKYLETTWSQLKKECAQEQIKNIERLLGEISTFSKKWKTAEYLKSY